MSSSRGNKANRVKATALAAGLSLVAIMLVGAAPSWAATSSPTFDNVQIFVHTANSTFTGTYTVTAYNSTGDAVITYQTPYPAASFELPSASYIFSVSADSQYQGYCYPVTPVTTATGVSSPPVSTATASSGSSSGGAAIKLPPCYLGYPQSEYGFVAQQVTGPTSITVSTVPIQNFPTTTVSVHVTYANGTAASGASVYANVLGGNWYSIDGNSVLNTSGQVGNDGNAKLVVPTAPVQVTAWNWVPVNLPKSPGTTQVTVGGEKVNVSVTWQPAYVGFAGSVLIVPPQTSASIVLKLQQPQFWATPLGVANQGSLSSATSTGAAAVSGAAGTVSSTPNLVPASLTSAQSTGQASTQTVVQTSTVTEPRSSPPVTTATTTSTTPAATNYDTVLFTVVGALALGIASASLIIVRRRPDA